MCSKCTFQSRCRCRLTSSYAREERLWRYHYQLQGPGHSPSEVMHPSGNNTLPLSLTYEAFRTHSLTPSWCCSSSLCHKYLWTLGIVVHKFPREHDTCGNFLPILLPLWHSKPSLPFFFLTCFLRRRLVGIVQDFHANSWARPCQFSIPLLLNMTQNSAFVLHIFLLCVSVTAYTRHMLLIVLPAASGAFTKIRCSHKNICVQKIVCIWHFNPT